MKRSGFKWKPTWKKLERKPFKRKPGKKYKGVNRVSAKRRAEGAIYTRESRIFLEENPFCTIKSPVCTNIATTIQHVRGRVGKYFLDKKHWKASCWLCNGYCEQEKQWAFDNGHREDRLGKLNDEDNTTTN